MISRTSFFSNHGSGKQVPPCPGPATHPLCQAHLPQKWPPFCFGQKTTERIDKKTRHGTTETKKHFWKECGWTWCLIGKRHQPWMKQNGTIAMVGNMRAAAFQFCMSYLTKSQTLTQSLTHVRTCLALGVLPLVSIRNKCVLLQTCPRANTTFNPP